MLVQQVELGEQREHERAIGASCAARPSACPSCPTCRSSPRRPRRRRRRRRARCRAGPRARRPTPCSPPGSSPPNTTTVRTFGIWSRTSATSGACSASTTTVVASELSMTYAISSALNRYDSGTATRPSLRAAWIVARTSSEFGPHHTSRSPASGARGEQAVGEPVDERVQLGERRGRRRCRRRCRRRSRRSRRPASARALREHVRAVRSWRRAHPTPPVDVCGPYPTVRASDASFGVRGVVEGFYGTPWSHDARLEMITFLGDAAA